MSSHPQLILNSKNARHFDGRHPWVLSRSIVEATAGLEPGEVVELIQPNGSWIGRGIYNPASRIRIRLFQWERDQTLDVAWIDEQLEFALRLRERWMANNRTLDAIRLVNSEGDGLSGLIVDRFGSYLIIQINSLAMHQWIDHIVDWFAERLQPDGLHVSMEPGIASQEGLEPFADWRFGKSPDSALELDDEGVAIQVDLNAGQKTGYYLDQRANRIAAARWMRSGNLLDVCCYQGGFSLAACKQGRVSEAMAVDSSRRALEVAASNATRNGIDQIHFEQVDCFDFLRQLSDDGRTFDNIVLDPPKMAGHRKQIGAALRAYHRLNLSALEMIKPGGNADDLQLLGPRFHE